MKVFLVIVLVYLHAAHGSGDSSGGSSSGSSECGVIQNVALNKPASQSTTRGSWDASKAVDGNRDNNIRANHCTHTDLHGAFAWWKVDLLESFDITKIVVFNRGDCCGEKIIDATIRVGNCNDNFAHNTKIGQILREQSVYTFDIDPPQRGRYVSVQIETGRINPLHMCEVQVFGRKS